MLVANDKWWGAKPVTAKVTVWPRGADIQDRVNTAPTTSSTSRPDRRARLNLPDDYVRTDTPSAGIEQLIFAPRARWPIRPRAARVALCTPRDVIARNAEVPIANSRLNPAAEDSITAAESAGRSRAVQRRQPATPRGRAINGRPLTVRIGYQSPNARLAATVGTIAKSCAAAGITVQDAASDSVGPQRCATTRSTC